MATPPASRIATMCCRPRSPSPPVTMMTFPASGGIGLHDNLCRALQHGVPQDYMGFRNPSGHGRRHDERLVAGGRTVPTIPTEEAARPEALGSGSAGGAG